MSTRKQITFLFVVLLALLLAACSEIDQALPETGDGLTPTPPVESPDLPPAAVLDAQNWLALQLNVPVEQVEILESEQAVWTDSCLGLGQPDESCLAADTPGWRVIFQVNGEAYEVRTDETASEIRLVPQE